MAEVVTPISGPTFELIPSLGIFAFVKVDLVEGYTKFDNYSNREIAYHRTSYADTLNGDYITLHSQPFGYKGVSG